MERVICVLVYFSDNYKIKYTCRNKNEISMLLRKYGISYKIDMIQTRILLPSMAVHFDMLINSSEKDFDKLVKNAIYENEEKFGEKIIEAIEDYRRIYNVDNPNFSIYFEEGTSDFSEDKTDDTLEYNQCFGRRNRKLRHYIKRYKKLLSETEK